MACTFIALFSDPAAARRAAERLANVPGVDRAYDSSDADALIARLGVAPQEARRLREGSRHGERIVVIQISASDPTACEVLHAVTGANLLIRADHAAGERPRAEEVYRPRPPMESIRSDMYIG